MNLTLIRSMTRSAVFELENELCYRPAHPFTVALNGKTVYEACNTNVFSLFSLLPGTTYTVEVQAEGETLKLDFTTEAETFFVDAARYGLVADGETDNTVRLQAALSTCPKGGTVYVPAGRYRTASLFMKSNTTLYLEKGAVLLGDNDRTHYPILPGVLPSENEVDEYYLTGWEGNPLDSFAGLLNITQVHDVVVTGEGTLDCDAQNGDWWVNPKVKRIAWRPRAVAAVDSENVCLHGITVQNSFSWTIHPIFVKHLDLLNFNINNPYNAPNTDGIDPESCEYIRIIGMNIHVGDDCIAMKASKVFLGMKLKRSCEHTVIRNCLLDKGQDPPRPRQHRRHRRAGVPQRGDAGRQGTLCHQYVLLLRPGRPRPLCAVPRGDAGGRVHPQAGQPDHGEHRGHRCPVRGLLLRRPAGAAHRAGDHAGREHHLRPQRQGGTGRHG